MAEVGVLPPGVFAGRNNRLVMTCLLLHQRVAITLLLRKLAPDGIGEEATGGEAVVEVPGA